MSTASAPRVVTYPLEQLFQDQDRDWVVDTIAPVLAWVPGKSKKKLAQPYRFEIEHAHRKGVSKVLLDLSWDEAKLERLVPDVEDRARRLRTGRTAQREHLTELAAYGLTFVAISTLMPGRRVVHMQMGVAPDIVLDLTPAALRGVETAGRKTGGRSALSGVRTDKAATLVARSDLAEVHLSLWCASPRLGTMEQLKP